MNRHKISVVIVLVISVLTITFSFYIYQMLMVPNILVEKQDKILLIPEGATFSDVQHILQEEGYVQDLLSFSVLAKLMKYNEYVKPGRYLLKKDMPNLQAIRLLRSGQQEPVDVTFNNIRLKHELAERICANLQADSGTFEAMLNDSVVASKYGFTTENIMCMFIPNTYELFWTTSAQQLFDRMHREYQKFWTDERLARAKAMGMTPVEVAILASIVESETNKPDEAPKVAGLYINRLKQNMALQADPTLKFAAQDFTIKRVLNKHIAIDSPYNTYKYTGLPPGPIRLPSVKSLNAVLNHENHKYLYMCAREDFSGYHNFATNHQAHLVNARKYQRALNSAGIYK